MKSPHSRQELLRQAFCEIPSQIGPYKLRPISGGSFELLGALRNSLVDPDPESQLQGSSLQRQLTAIHEFIWIHSAPIEQVLAVETRDQLPSIEIRKIGMSLPIGECIAFTAVFVQASIRMAAAMTEAFEDEDSSPGKPQTPPTGSPRSSSPAEPLETLPANVTSFGSRQSKEPSPTSTPPNATPADDADGYTPLMELPTIPASNETPPVSPISPLKNSEPPPNYLN